MNPASSGDFNLDSGSLTVNGSIRVGIEGFGQFNQTNGSVKIKGNDQAPLESALLQSDPAIS